MGPLLSGMPEVGLDAARSGVDLRRIAADRLVSRDLLQLSTDGVRPQERVDYWREMVLRLFADVEIASRVDDGFYGRMQSRVGDGVRFTVVDAASQAVQRVHREAREQYEDCYFAVLMLSGTQWMEQDGRQALLGPRDFALYDGSRPHRLAFSRQWGEIILNIPRATLHALLPGTERFTATRVPRESALGSVLQSFLGSMACEIHRLDPSQLGTLTEHAVGLIATTLADSRGDDAALSRHRGATLLRVKAFVEQRLDDPQLDATRIAAELRLSARYLNKLFEAERTSLMRYVWRRRLERCRADLLDAAHAGARIGDIALRWGFNDLSHFSRAFRDRFGHSPRDLRRQRSAESRES